MTEKLWIGPQLCADQWQERSWNDLSLDEQDTYLDKVREEYGEEIGPKEALRLAEQAFNDER